MQQHSERLVHHKTDGKTRREQTLKCRWRRVCKSQKAEWQ